MPNTLLTPRIFKASYGPVPHTTKKNLVFVQLIKSNGTYLVVYKTFCKIRCFPKDYRGTFLYNGSL